MDWLRDHMWEAWLGLAVLFGVLELISMDLFLVMLAGGALVGAVTALLGGPPGLQVVLGHMGEMVPYSLGRASGRLARPAGLPSLKEVYARNAHVKFGGYSSLDVLKRC
jgi:membrane protein implicated in regulation of membrane protease activity